MEVILLTGEIQTLCDSQLLVVTSFGQKVTHSKSVRLSFIYSIKCVPLFVELWQ